MATRMKMDMLTAIEQIVELAKESQLSKEFFRKADKYIKYVSEKMDNTLETLTAYCDSERLETKEIRKIGF